MYLEVKINQTKSKAGKTAVRHQGELADHCGRTHRGGREEAMVSEGQGKVALSELPQLRMHACLETERPDLIIS